MKHNQVSCNVLGRYCWTCKKVTETGIPGWPKGMKANDNCKESVAPKEAFQMVQSKSIGHNPYENLTNVVWMNGDNSSVKDQRPCNICGKHCSYPVERSFLNQYDGYREIVVGKLLE